MPKRNVTHRPLKQYAGGDLNKRITLHTRTLKAPKYNSASFTENYDAGLEVWASVITLSNIASGKRIFDDIDIRKQPTHKFVIRFREGITTEKVVRWRGDAYELVKIIDPEERHEWLELYAKLLGDETKETNQ